MDNLGKVLRLLRCALGLTQKQLAEKIGKSSSAISDYESGVKVPTLFVLEAYAHVFYMPVSSILFLAERYGQSFDPDECIVSDRVLAMLRLLRNVYAHS